MRFILTLALLLSLAVSPSAAQDDAPAQPTNVILIIPDGYGPASATLARDYLRAQQGIASLAQDSLQVGSVRTFASDSRITDSAAGATAYATGVKTYNGAIAVDTLQQPVATLLEAAEKRGLATGLVATSRITHATPASFSAHVPSRWMENEIAAQQLEQDIEVIFGGGRRHFLPESENGRRSDGRNLLNEARSAGYEVAQDRVDFDRLSATPALGLFSMSHMAYEIDRNPKQQPSLAEMTAKAIDLLDDDPEGFFLMVEASRIDHAGHSNDAAAHLHDILAFNEAVKVAIDAAERDSNTLVVSVSDHETGGMTLGRNGIYSWKPAPLAAVKGSHGAIIDAAQNADESGDDPVATVAEMTGIDNLTAEEEALIRDNVSSYDRFNQLLRDIISRRSLIGWTTDGHTAIDVNLYAFGPGAERFVGNHDNTYVGTTLADLLNVDLRAVAPRVPASSEASMGDSR
jgi:alkaline phosphatase